MEIQPLISIIVPVYHTVAYLPSCVGSIQAQTYRNLEILLVDDGSTDGSGQLCEELAQKDARIRVLHQENGGASAARNRGIAAAKGAYLGFVDSDDEISPDMYELLYRALTAYRAKAAQAGREERDEDGTRLPDVCTPPEETVCIGAEEFLRELLRHRGDCSFCTKLLPREFFAQDAFPVGVLNEDFGLMIRKLPQLCPLVSLPRRTYRVRYRPGSSTRPGGREPFSRVFSDGVDNADRAAELVAARYPALAPDALRFGVFQRLEYLLHIPVSQMHGGNGKYRQIVGWLRGHWAKAMRNPVLTRKNKLYHTLFAIAPKGIRLLHRAIRRV
ncbi:MAG: glycosyltransferase [Clostridium sp.]|jgi:glycosyltransferase involved in cell wall biosynthesis|nr:glycosyltransferase [Clostridium sp.]